MHITVMYAIYYHKIYVNLGSIIMNQEKAALTALHGIRGLGNRSLWKLKALMGDFRSVLYADRKQFMGVNLPDEVVQAILDLPKLDVLEEQLDKITRQGIRIITFDEEDYPYLLRDISNPPYILYARGNINLTGHLCLAIVGSRIATAYGKMAAHKFARELVQNDVVIVSGMARGIDTEAHLGALEGQGPTIAVLGSGLDIIYPPENRRLFQEICANGIVISECPLGMAPEPGNFPSRNRIISGLSRGVIVAEAMEKSGALITADFALEQGRDVFAIPGPINSKTSAGTNNLIKQGAKLITCVEDVLEEYYFHNNEKSKDQQQLRLLLLDKNEEIIVECIESQPVHFDEILAATGLEIGTLSTILLKLEFEGIIKSLPGNSYVKIF